MSLDAWKRAGAGTLRALNALSEFNKRHAQPPQPRVVERWVAWHPDRYESYAGTTAEEAWMHAMQYECEEREKMLRAGWHVSLVRSAQEPKAP